MQELVRSPTLVALRTAFQGRIAGGTEAGTWAPALGGGLLLQGLLSSRMDSCHSSGSQKLCGQPRPGAGQQAAPSTSSLGFLCTEARRARVAPSLGKTQHPCPSHGPPAHPLCFAYFPRWGAHYHADTQPCFRSPGVRGRMLVSLPPGNGAVDPWEARWEVLYIHQPYYVCQCPAHHGCDPGGHRGSVRLRLWACLRPPRGRQGRGWGSPGTQVFCPRPRHSVPLPHRGAPAESGAPASNLTEAGGLRLDQTCGRLGLGEAAAAAISG